MVEPATIKTRTRALPQTIPVNAEGQAEEGDGTGSFAGRKNRAGERCWPAGMFCDDVLGCLQGILTHEKAPEYGEKVRFFLCCIIVALILAYQQ